MNVAVLMSTYNGEKYIQEQIDSVFSQKGQFSIDLWIRDDGSSDNTVSIIKKNREKYSIHYFEGTNLRPASSFCYLILNSGDYDYYAFADQDDYWLDCKIEKGIAALQDISGPALYFCNANVVNSDLESLGKKVYSKEPRTDFETLTCAGGLLGCGMVFNNHLMKIIRQNKTDITAKMHDFFVSVLCKSVGGEIVYDDQSCLLYRQHNENVVGVSHGFIDAIKKKRRAVFEKPPVGIDAQSRCILTNYTEFIDDDRRKWLYRVSNYRKNIISRVLLAFSKKTSYYSYNMSLTIRMSILFGNR